MYVFEILHIDKEDFILFNRVFIFVYYKKSLIYSVSPLTYAPTLV